MRVNIRIGGNKKQGFLILFLFQFAKQQRRRVRKPINNENKALVQIGTITVKDKMIKFGTQELEQYRRRTCSVPRNQ